MAGLWFWAAAESPKQVLARARAAFVQARYAEAEQLAVRVSRDAQDSAAALEIAGSAALKRGRLEAAVLYLDQIPDDGSAAAVEARALAGDILLNGLYRPSEAEERLRRALAQNPR